MTAMKTSVIAEAWIRVSRSGHWTRLQLRPAGGEEADARAPRWRSGWRRRLRRAALLRAPSRAARARAPRCSALPGGSILSARPPRRAPTSAREGAGAVRLLRSALPLELVERRRRARRARPRCTSADSGTWVSCCARTPRRARRRRALLLACCARRCSALRCALDFATVEPASGFPCARCAGRTSGSTCASRSGPACCAATCWSGSCAACTPRRRGLRRFVRLREPSAPLITR